MTNLDALKRCGDPIEYTKENCPPEMLPLFDWEISEQTKREIREAEQNIALSAHRAQFFLVD
ncbi:MAG: hypothetical protein WAT93_14755 [Pontixanthobacter sp.]